jgi:outer membrane protein assembly factor BamA
LFADAGTVWVNKKQAELPGAEFNPARIIQELAVGVGFGIRMDLNFFVLRLDMAIPVRKPGLPETQRWVLNQTDASKIIFNIAFGYPF